MLEKSCKRGCPLNLSAAFDPVDHDVLLNRLSTITSFGVRVSALYWFAFYLSLGVGSDANIAPVLSVKNLGSWFDHVTPTLIRLQWPPACFRTEHKILILSFKAIYGVARSFIL